MSAEVMRMHIKFKIPLAYLEDLRWRIVWLNVLQGVHARDVARHVQVSERTIHRYAERFRVTRYVRWSSKRSGPPHLLSEHEELLLVHFSPGNVPAGASTHALQIHRAHCRHQYHMQGTTSPRNDTSKDSTCLHDNHRIKELSFWQKWLLMYLC